MQAIISKHSQPSPYRTTEVAFYKAVIYTKVESSSLAINQVAPLESVAAAIRCRPAVIARGWLEPASPESLYVASVRKLINALHSGVDIPGETASELFSNIGLRYPLVAQASSRTAYARLNADAAVWNDGEVTWGFSIVGDAPLFPGLDEDAPDISKSSLHVFVRNMLRADLQGKLESLVRENKNND